MVVVVDLLVVVEVVDEVEGSGIRLDQARLG